MPAGVWDESVLVVARLVVLFVGIALSLLSRPVCRLA